MSDRYVKQWNVKGSTGNTYVVSLNKNGEYECSCPRWIYARKECKHIRRLKEEAQAQQASPVIPDLAGLATGPRQRPAARKVAPVKQQPQSPSSVKGMRQIKLKRKL